MEIGGNLAVTIVLVALIGLLALSVWKSDGKR